MVVSVLPVMTACWGLLCILAEKKHPSVDYRPSGKDYNMLHLEGPQVSIIPFPFPEDSLGTNPVRQEKKLSFVLYM